MGLPMLLKAWIETLVAGLELKGWVLACSRCRELFVSKRQDARYCSSACRQAEYRGRP